MNQAGDEKQVLVSRACREEHSQSTKAGISGRLKCFLTNAVMM